MRENWGKVGWHEWQYKCQLTNNCAVCVLWTRRQAKRRAREQAAEAARARQEALEKRRERKAAYVAYVLTVA